MPLIRSKEEAQLGELLAVGRGMLLRYAELREGDLGDLDGTLAAVIEARTELLERLASLDRERGDLPPAGDHEINQINALVDGLVAAVLGSESLRERLLRAEEGWKDLLDCDDDFAWRDEEVAVLDALRAENDAAIAALHAQTD